MLNGLLPEPLAGLHLDHRDHVSARFQKVHQVSATPFTRHVHAVIEIRDPRCTD